MVLIWVAEFLFLCFCFSYSFLTSVSYSLPIVLMVAWVVFIAAFVKKLVYEKDLRLHEVCRDSPRIMNKIRLCNNYYDFHHGYTNSESLTRSS